MQNITEILGHQHDSIVRLLETLKDEQAALTGNNLPALEAATAAKQTCLTDIEQFFHLQTRLVEAAGFALDDRGMSAYLRQCDPQERLGLELRWRQIKELFGRCREQNLLNGRVVTINHRQTQRAISILRGDGLNNDACYGPRGQTNNNLAIRSLGKV